MQREIRLKNVSPRLIRLGRKIIKYEVRESARARCLRITIHPGGELSATLPRGININKLEYFIQQKTDWILRKINLAKKRKPIVVIPKSSHREYLAVKSQALKLAKLKIEELNKFYNFQYSLVSIRNQKTRWGSCSRKGNLNFNYRIIYLPEKYLDYIIVHELCHLKQFNHSKNFWELVGQAIPDYKILRKEIRNL